MEKRTVTMARTRWLAAALLLFGLLALLSPIGAGMGELAGTQEYVRTSAAAAVDAACGPQGCCQEGLRCEELCFRQTADNSLQASGLFFCCPPDNPNKNNCSSVP